MPISRACRVPITQMVPAEVAVVPPTCAVFSHSRTSRPSSAQTSAAVMPPAPAPNTSASTVIVSCSGDVMRYTRHSRTRASGSGRPSASTIRLVSIDTINAPATEIATPAEHQRPDDLVRRIEPGGKQHPEHQGQLQERHHQHDRRNGDAGEEKALRRRHEHAGGREPARVVRVIEKTLVRIAGETKASAATAVAAT